MSHGFGTLAADDQNPSLFVSQRTRLNFDYKHEIFATRIVLQDVRLWGSQPQLVGNEDKAASIHEAWGELYMSPKWSLRVGRQEVSYDDQRIFGAVNWAQQARSHDMALVQYNGSFKLHIGVAYHENDNRTNNVYNGPDGYKTFQYLWFHKDFENPLKISMLFLNNGIEYPLTTNAGNEVIREAIRFSQTIGGRLTYKTDAMELGGNLYAQFGKHLNTRSLSAFNLSLESMFALSEKAHAGICYEILSGTAFDETEKNHSFAPFYGTNHKFNGTMDYFYVGNHFNNTGLHDLFVKADWTPAKVTFKGELHLFNSYAPVSDDASGYLGTEIDLTASYKWKNWISFEMGYSQLFAGKSMEILKGGSRDALQNWAYVMLSFQPVFWDSAKQ